MREKLRITSKLKETQFVGKELIGNEWMILTEDFYLVNLNTFENDPTFKSKKMLRINFTVSSPTWEMTYETQDKATPPAKDRTEDDLFKYNQISEENKLNKRKRIAIKEFFSKHNQLEHGTDFENNFTPKSMIIGTVEIVTQKGRLAYLADRKKVKVFNMIDQMSWQEQYDLILYYAPEYAGLRRSEALAKLIGLKGIATREAFMGGKMWQRQNVGTLTNADDFLLNYQSNPMVVMKIYVNKAIHYKIISQGANGLMIHGNTYVGKDSDDAVVYFSKDVQTYINYIQKEVNKLDNLPEDDLIDEPNDTMEKDRFQSKVNADAATSQYKDDYKKLMREAEELLGSSSVPESKRSYKALTEYVEELRAAKSQVARENASPTQVLTEKVDDLATSDITKLKQIAKDEGIDGWASYKSVGAIKDKIKAVRKNKAVQPQV